MRERGREKEEKEMCSEDREAKTLVSNADFLLRLMCRNSAVCLTILLFFFIMATILCPLSLSSPVSPPPLFFVVVVTQQMSRFNIWEAAFKFCRWGSPSNLLPDQSIFKEPGRFIVSGTVVDFVLCLRFAIARLAAWWVEHCGCGACGEGNTLWTFSF